ncbi:hydrophobin-251 [Crucibulum laeve]|uniref:Hydrophobin n=1 Tax=Crucibulum laeve TaxID=68775 RepID=A0A5C3LY59_9AGAR|nr:hydrophobin-251 [Crucibulum laeve]
MLSYKSIILATAAFSSMVQGQRIISPNQCNTGPIQCCQGAGRAYLAPYSALLALLGIVVQDSNILVGVTCTPITIIGVGAGSCNALPLCCADNSYNGIVAVGCDFVNLSL